MRKKIAEPFKIVSGKLYLSSNTLEIYNNVYKIIDRILLIFKL